MIPEGVRIYVCTQPMDMRCSFDGLEIAVRAGLGLDPRSGGMYVFFNRRADQVRVLFWDRNGYAIFAKRLDCARFRGVEAKDGARHLEIDSHRLLVLLDDAIQARTRRNGKTQQQSAPVSEPSTRPKLELMRSGSS